MKAAQVPLSNAMIGELLPADAVSVELFEDLLDPERYPEARLFPEEEAVIAQAVEKRRREFTSVRVCARRAMAGLGFGPLPLIPGERGAPGWPAGVVGSMTHCDGYRAAAVAWDKSVASLGIDAEPAQPLPAGVAGVVTVEPERGHLAALAAAHPAVPWDRLLFSAKESVYKTWFPLMRIWLDFHEARITFRVDGTFTARLLVPGPTVDGQTLDTFNGRWLVRNGLAVTAIAVLRPTAAES